MTTVIPPPVEGDPAGMRALAGVLRRIGDAFGDLGTAMQNGLGSLAFEGPAASRLRDELTNLSRRLTQRGSRLHGLADTVLHSAGQVEDAQNERSRLIAFKEQEDAATARVARR